MSRKRVAWDGPDPAPGDYLAGRKGGLWLIREVEPIVRRAPDDDVRLLIDLVAAPGRPPDGARVHPRILALPSARDGPPRVRQTAQAGGEAAIMRTAWRDPDDTRPTAARQARRVTGYRTYCPLRRMRTLAGSQIEERHILAADRLRLNADIAALGFSAVATLEPRSQAYGPSLGPSEAQMDRTGAAREVQQALARFTLGHRAMLTEIVLLNHSLAQWCALQATPTFTPDPKLEMGKLIAVLDLLAKHYDLEIKDDLAADRLMGEA